MDNEVLSGKMPETNEDSIKKYNFDDIKSVN